MRNRDWLFVLGIVLLVVTACDNDPAIRVYIENPAMEEINVFKSCEGITETSKEEAADYVVTTKLIRRHNRYIDETELSIATADGDFIFSKRNRRLLQRS